MSQCASTVAISNRYSPLEVETDSSQQSTPIQGNSPDRAYTQVALVEHTYFNKYVVKPTSAILEGSLCTFLSIAEKLIDRTVEHERETESQREKRQKDFMTARRKAAIETRKRENDEREKRNHSLIEDMYKQYMNAKRHVEEAKELDSLCENGPGVFATRSQGLRDKPQPLMQVLLQEINTYHPQYRERIDRFIGMITTYEEVAYVKMILKRKMYFVMKDRRLQEESRAQVVRNYMTFWSTYKPILDHLEAAISMKAMASGAIGVQGGNEFGFPDIDYSDKGCPPIWDDTSREYADDTFVDRMKRVYSYKSESLSTVASFKDMLADVMDSLEGTCIKTCAPYVRCMEDIALFYFLDVPNINTKTDAIFHLYRLAKSITGYSVCDVSFSWINKIIKRINNCLDISTQSGDLCEEEGFFAKFLKGTAYDQVQKLVCALSTVALGHMFFSDSGDSDKKSEDTRGLFEKAWDYFRPLLKKKMKFDIVSTVFEFCKWLVTRGIEVLKGERTLSSVFFEQDAAQHFDERVAGLEFLHDAIETGSDPTSTLEKYMFEVCELEALCRKEFEATDNKIMKVTLQRQLTLILHHKTEMLRMYETESVRIAPFAVLLFGTTSVGKTVLSGLMAPQLQKAMGVKQGPEYVFNFDTNDKYMSGITYDKNAIVLDDLGNTALEFTEKVASDFVIYLINNYKRFAIKADVESKGKIPLRPAVVIGSTNVPDLHSKRTSVEPLSILRRFEYHVEVIVKDECGEGPDGKKMIKKRDHNPMDHGFDCWEMNLYRYVPHDGAEPFFRECVPNMQKVSFETAMKFLVSEAHAYRIKQEALVARMKTIHLDEYCEHNIFKYLCKQCNAQAVERRRIEQAVESIPLNLQVGVMSGSLSEDISEKAKWLTSDTRVVTMAGNSLEEATRKFIWNVGHQSDRFAAWCKANSIKPEPAAKKSRSSMSIGWTAKFIMSMSLWSRHKVTWWQTLAMSATGICLAPLLAWSTPLYAIAWPVGVLSTYVCTSATRVARYMRVSPMRTVAEAVRSIREDWKKSAKALGPLCMVVVSSYAAYKLWKYVHRDDVTSQGCTVSLPIPSGVTGRKDPYRPPAISIPLSNLDLKTATSKQIATVVEQKLCILRFKKGSEYKEHCVTMPLCTGYWFVPIHLLQKDFDSVDFIKCTTLHNNSTRNVRLAGAWKRIANTDYALLYAPSMGDQRDLRKLLPDGDKLETKGVGAKCVWLKATAEKMPEGDSFISLSRGQYSVHFNTEYVKPYNLDFGYEGGKYESPSPTWDGMCGSVVIADICGPVILGLHSAGQGGTSQARTCTVLRKDVQACLDSMTSKDTSQLLAVQSGDFSKSLNYKGTNFEYIPTQRPRATSIFVDNGAFEVLGSTTAPHRTNRSSVKPTLVADTVCKIFDISVKHGAPKYIGHWGPWNAWVSAMSHPSDIPCDILDKAYLDYRTKIMDAWKPEWDERIHPLHEDAVLSGIDGLQGCYAMNFKASMGIPYCKPKGDFIKPSNRVVENVSFPRDMPDHLRKEIEDMEKALAEGYRVYSPHRCSLKDEPIKLVKDKVRVFMGSAFAYQYLMRKYFLMISIIMQENPEIFESAVGIKACSPEWTRLRNYIASFGEERGVAGDYVKYDQLMDVKVLMAVFKILIAMNERAGYNEFQLSVCVGLATETCMAVYEVRNEWMQFNCGNSSGNPLTVVLNSCGGSILQRCAFYGLKPKDCTDLFHKYVALITYGDDNAMTVSEKIPWFNHTTIAEILSGWGMKYTMADKESASVPYIPVSTIEFLKRKWVWDAKYKQYLCPLAEDSIHKALTCALTSDTLTVEQHSAEIIAGANLEYFFYGKETFEKRHSQLKEVLEVHNITHHVPGGRLKTFVELEAWYLE